MSAIQVVIIEDQQQTREMLSVLVNGTDGYQCVAAFEKYLDEMIKQIRKEYSKNFPEGISQHETVTQIFYQLDLVRF